MKFFLLLSLIVSVNVFANQGLYEKECETQRSGFTAIELADGMYGMFNDESKTAAAIYCGTTNSDLNGIPVTRVITLDYGRCINVTFFEHKIYFTCNQKK